MINIDELISGATKEKSPALGVYRLIKTEFLRWTKDNPGKDFDATVEAKILKKMYDQRKESFDMYTQLHREDLAGNEAFEAGIIKAFLPEEVPTEEIEFYTKSIILSNYDSKVTMKDMKTILSLVQEKYPSASGKIVSAVVKSFC